MQLRTQAYLDPTLPAALPRPFDLDVALPEPTPLPTDWDRHPLMTTPASAIGHPFARMVYDFAAGRYVFADPAVRSITGFTTDELTEGGIQFFISRYDSQAAPVSRAIVTDMLLAFRRLTPQQRATVHTSAVHRFRTAAGEWAWLLSQSVPILIDEPTGMVRLSLSYLSNITPHYFLSRPSGSISFAESFDADGRPISYTSLELPLQSPQPGVELSRRERDVLRLIVVGKTSKEIADDLELAPPTVNTHRKNLLIKTRCRNTAELVRFAVSFGLV